MMHFTPTPSLDLLSPGRVVSPSDNTTGQNGAFTDQLAAAVQGLGGNPGSPIALPGQQDLPMLAQTILPADSALPAAPATGPSDSASVSTPSDPMRIALEDTEDGANNVLAVDATLNSSAGALGAAILPIQWAALDRSRTSDQDLYQPGARSRSIVTRILTTITATGQLPTTATETSPLAAWETDSKNSEASPGSMPAAPVHPLVQTMSTIPPTSTTTAPVASMEPAPPVENTTVKGQSEQLAVNAPAFSAAPTVPAAPATNSAPATVATPADQPQATVPGSAAPLTAKAPATNAAPAIVATPADQPQATVPGSSAPLTAKAPATNTAPATVTTPADQPQVTVPGSAAPLTAKAPASNTAPATVTTPADQPQVTVQGSAAPLTTKAPATNVAPTAVTTPADQPQATVPGAAAPLTAKAPAINTAPATVTTPANQPQVTVQGQAAPLTTDAPITSAAPTAVAAPAAQEPSPVRGQTTPMAAHQAIIDTTLSAVHAGQAQPQAKGKAAPLTANAGPTTAADLPPAAAGMPGTAAHPSRATTPAGNQIVQNQYGQILTIHQAGDPEETADPTGLAGKTTPPLAAGGQVQDITSNYIRSHLPNEATKTVTNETSTQQQQTDQDNQAKGTNLAEPIIEDPNPTDEAGGQRPQFTLGSENQPLVFSSQSTKAAWTNSTTDALNLRLPSGLNVSTGTVVDQMATHFANTRPLESGTVSLRLHPQELGELRMEIKVEQDNIKAHIIAQNPQAQEMIDRHLPRLREALAQQGLHLQHIEVTVAGGDQGSGQRFQDTSRQQLRQSMHKGAGQSLFTLGADEEPVDPASPVNNLSVLA